MCVCFACQLVLCEKQIIRASGGTHVKRAYTPPLRQTSTQRRPTAAQALHKNRGTRRYSFPTRQREPNPLLVEATVEVWVEKGQHGNPRETMLTRDRQTTVLSQDKRDEDYGYGAMPQQKGLINPKLYASRYELKRRRDVTAAS